eukprot:3519921-Alexandrium_andersonii.AAC.1
MGEEVQWLGSLQDFTWQRLSNLCQGEGANPRSLRSDTLQAAAVQVAFCQYRFIRAAQGLPWSLCRGDIKANLERLAASEPTTLDSVSAK